ncbi:FeoC-like transcriptional regulator [Streptomyces gamaensis]|uniref:FeoC-like transcriptional regulator n=1 Tax=Streptomyces gamaensis TaxID=1763542 RepID=A0ABW0YW97_9ACTN
MSASVSPLRHILRLVQETRGSLRLEELAERAGVAPDEAASMVDYWVARGVLTREEVGGGCPAAGCGGCALKTSCAPSGRAGGGGIAPVLYAIRPARPADGGAGQRVG